MPRSTNSAKVGNRVPANTNTTVPSKRPIDVVHTNVRVRIAVAAKASLSSVSGK